MADPRIPQSRAEIEGHLREQVSFLLASVDLFDAGELAEAKRLAAQMRTLLHDGQGKSLFAQLGLKRGKRRLLFYDAVGDLTDPAIGYALGGVGLMIAMGPDGPKGSWTPALDPPGLPKGATRRIWHDWWTRWIMKDSLETGFSRRDVVLPMAQQDGGVHVDQALDRRYAELSRRNAMLLLEDAGDGPHPLPNIELVCVRHIAHELLVTLASQVAWAFADGDMRLRYVRETFAADGGTGQVKCSGRRPSFSLLRQAK